MIWVDAPDREVVSVAHRVSGDPDLTKLGEVPRAEAIRVAMLLYGWDAATAARKVDSEQRRYSEEEAAEPNKKHQSA
jgi:hypothetical protein